MFTMSKKYNGPTWVGNMFQTFEAVCQDVEDFVKKDTVKYVENHMQIVGENVKQFYSEVVQDILPPIVDRVKHAAQSVPSKQMDLVVGIKENTVDCNTNKSEEGFLECRKPSITGHCHAEADAGVDIIQQEGDTLVNKTSDKAFQDHLNSDTSNQENLAVEQSPCKDGNFNDDPTAKITRESSESDVSVYEDADCGTENDIVDLNLGINKNINGHSSLSPSEDLNVSVQMILFTTPIEEKLEDVSTETLVNDLGISCSQEEKTLDEFECDSNTSNTLGSIVYSENKEECCIGFVPAKLCDSSSSSCRNSREEPDTIYCDNNNDNNNITELAFSSYALSDGSAKTDEAVSRTGLCRSEDDHCCKLAQFEASVACAKIGEDDNYMVDVEDLNMDTIDLSDKKQLAESCVIVEGEQLYAYSLKSRRSKSYKKIIQDAFMSKKRLAKEYKQLAIWYGDIDTEFSPSTENAISNIGMTPKSPVQDSRDSEWELV